MSLEEKLAATRAMVVARIPPERRVIMERVTEELRKFKKVRVPAVTG